MTLRPGIAAVMHAIKDIVRDTYSPPFASETEANLARDAQLRHLPIEIRDRMFPVVAVIVTVEPARFVPGPYQAALFHSPGEARADH